MQITNQEVWQSWVTNNTDSYGKGVMDYAQRWADLMEARIGAGDDLLSCAKDTSHQADTEGVTGFMYGAAVSVLASCWRYGEQLRRWHNLDTQIHAEGEEANKRQGAVLNPALVQLG